MQLVFEICSTAHGAPTARKTFDGVGGVIGRGAGCDWIIPDENRLISSTHGLVSYREGHYFLTDISSNGIGMSGSMERMCKGQARLISDGDVYQLGAIDIRAHLVVHARQSFASDGTIPDDAFLELDPVRALDREQLRGDSSPELDALALSARVPPQVPGHGPVDRDYLVAPTWAEPEKVEASPEAAVPEHASTQAFWAEFSRALGLPFETQEREALAIKVAGLFRQTIDGLQQSLRTRDELNNEFNNALAPPVLDSRNPLNDCVDTQAAMVSLLAAAESGQFSAEQAIAHACRDLQVHQLALLVACRAALRSALSAFAPEHLLLCFEREGSPSRFATDGAHWRAYQRHYRRQTNEDPLAEQLLRNDFSKAYEEQVRLVSTLYAGYPG